MANIEVVPITCNTGDIKKFVKFSWKIYSGNPYWVPPLIFDQVKFIRKGPYHEVGIIQPFMAYREGKAVGRIIAHYDKRHNHYFKEKRGCVGFFESVDDKTVSRALFKASENWLIEQGMTTMVGPMNFLMYDPSGILIDHYEGIPPLELGYNPEYYAKLFEDYGFTKLSDWYAYRFTDKSEFPEIYYKMRDRIVQRESEITYRTPDMNNYQAETEKIMAVFNKAWEDNFGHYPLTEKQIEFFAKELKTIMKPELVIMAEKNEELVGFLLALPDANLALKRANGRLFPFGLIKILLGMKKIYRIKIFMMGVLQEFRRKGFDAVFYVEILDRAKKMGYKEADCSLIEENNKITINMLNRLGAEQYKTYRFYSKTVGESVSKG